MKSFEDLQKDYTGDGEKSYLTLTVPVDCELKQYQIAMLERNSPRLLLQMSVQRVNDDWKLCYDVTSKIPLRRVLERKPVKHQEFQFIISQFADLIHGLKDHLLDLPSVVLDSTYIFCDPASFSLYFLYLPFNTEEKEPKRIQGFLRTLIVEEIRLAEDLSGGLLKRLLDALKAEAFTSELLYRCLNGGSDQASFPVNDSGVMGSFPVKEAGNGFVEAGDESPWVAGQNLQKAGNSSVQASDTIQTDWEKRSVPIPKPARENRPMQKDAAERPVMGPKTGKNPPGGNFRGYPVSSWLIAGSVNLLLLGLLIYILVQSGKNPNQTVNNLLGFLLIAGAGNYFLITRLFSKDKRITTRVEAAVSKPPVKRFVNREMDEDIILPKNLAARQREPMEKVVVPPKPPEMNYPETTENITSPSETSFGDNPVKAFPLYERNDAATTEQFAPHSSPEAQSFPVPELTPPAIAGVSQSVDISDKTMVLGRASQQTTAYLQSVARPHEKVFLDKGSLLLGRLADSVDYAIANRAVGKIHAEIKKIGEKFYITDLNSVNGTFVNGERLVCNVDAPLTNGDKITLANESFVFHE